RTGALMVRKDSPITSPAELRHVPVAVTWHAGTFYAAIEVLEAAGVPFEEIKLVHANDRLDALLSGKTAAAALMEPLVSRAAEAGARKIADLRWRGGIVRRQCRRGDGGKAQARAQPRGRMAAPGRAALARRIAARPQAGAAPRRAASGAHRCA